MVIGLPKAMLYYRYQILWETFFHELGFETVTSGDTNQKVLEDGVRYSIDESCLPSKIFMGHVHSLIGKCDYILIPRVVNYGYCKEVCVKFNALYDIVNNTFENVNILDYNLSVTQGEKEQKGFIKMGMILGKSPLRSLHAYKKAKKAQALHDTLKVKEQERILESEKLKLLIVSHPYITYDRFIGFPITEYIQRLGAIPIYADLINKKESLKRSEEISDSLYWLYNKELIGAIQLLEDKIDGIILLTAFPCGPDSLVNELILRKSKKLPTINIIVDELQGEAGLQTRIESFLDIIQQRLDQKEKIQKRIV
ncbi:acyl-CoA dehydratase activase-related protein [Sinanaerobacter sp. ZZT-01]|uniref:acyl-CoA dehydratase activase-related protein n=1 Tax=Sinanaerobacter sp. ZZT-01 TaxID=3111540 RepID=UPI002D78C3D7|nr:acyl-CoA dehydratase activase-related protein [Sinanaerobacter sp. ZZT-01]WRR93636.1 acyl-CoA dehydratase activase-related protein [Sinanaerobacter sp. ZZT-01]